MILIKNYLYLYICIHIHTQLCYWGKKLNQQAFNEYPGFSEKEHSPNTAKWQGPAVTHPMQLPPVFLSLQNPAWYGKMQPKLYAHRGTASCKLTREAGESNAKQEQYCLSINTEILPVSLGHDRAEQSQVCRGQKLRKYKVLILHVLCHLLCCPCQA